MGIPPAATNDIKMEILRHSRVMDMSLACISRQLVDAILLSSPDSTQLCLTAASRVCAAMLSVHACACVSAGGF